MKMSDRWWYFIMSLISAVTSAITVIVIDLIIGG